MSFLVSQGDDVLNAILEGRAYTRFFQFSSNDDVLYAIRPPSGREVVVYGLQLSSNAALTISSFQIGTHNSVVGFSTDTGVSNPIPLINLDPAGAAWTGTLHFDTNASIANLNKRIYYFTSTDSFGKEFASPEIITSRKTLFIANNTNDVFPIFEPFRLIGNNTDFPAFNIVTSASVVWQIQVWFYER